MENVNTSNPILDAGITLCLWIVGLVCFINSYNYVDITFIWVFRILSLVSVLMAIIINRKAFLKEVKTWKIFKK